MMTGEEFTSQMDQLATIGALVAEVDLDGLAETIMHAETLGPIIDPTAYMRGGREHLDQQRRLVTGARVFQAAVRQLQGEVRPDGNVPG